MAAASDFLTMQAGILTAETFLVGLYAARLAALEDLVCQRAEEARRQDRSDPESALHMRDAIRSLLNVRFPNVQKPPAVRLLLRWSSRSVLFLVVAVDTLLVAAVLSQAEFGEFSWSPRRLDVPVMASCLLWGISILVAMAGRLLSSQIYVSIHAWETASGGAEKTSGPGVGKATKPSPKASKRDPTEEKPRAAAETTLTTTSQAPASVRGASVRRGTKRGKARRR